MIANALTYEIMTPETVGRSRSELVLGKHSGRAGLAKRTAASSATPSATRSSKASTSSSSTLADKKKEVYDDDLRMLIVSLCNQDSFEDLSPLQVRCYEFRPRTRHGDWSSMRRVVTREFTDTANRRRPGRRRLQGHRAHPRRIKGRLEQLRDPRHDPRARTPSARPTSTVEVGAITYKGNGASTDIIEAAVHGLRQRRQQAPRPPRRAQ
jgi:2-isopropylmalate synthase